MFVNKKRERKYLTAGIFYINAGHQEAANNTHETP